MNTTDISILDSDRHQALAADCETGTLSLRRVSNLNTALPYIPRKRQERSGLLADYFFSPAEGKGTDYLDFLLLGENRFGVILADFSGILRGQYPEETIPLLKLALRSKSAGLSAAATLRYLDQHIAELAGDEGVITALYLIFDQSKRLLHYASAGHLPMLLHRSSESKTLLLTARGAPFGHESAGINSSVSVNNINKITGESIALSQGDLIVLYNSGLLKLRNGNGDCFGRQRLIECVHKYAELNPAPFLTELQKRLNDFIGGQPQEYDVTVIALKNILRDLENPNAETLEHAIADRFLRVEDEEIIIEAIREHPRVPLTEVADQLARHDLSHLGKDRLQAYLALTSHWLSPPPMNGHTGKNGTQIHNGANGHSGEKPPATRRPMSAIKQLQQDMVAAFPIRQALSRKFAFLDESPALARAKEFYASGEYQQALFEISSIRQDLHPSTDLHCFVGNLYLLLNITSEAKEEYLQALALDQRTPQAHLALSYVALLQEDFCTAIDEFSTALRLDKNLQENNPLLQQLITAAERRENRSEWLV